MLCCLVIFARLCPRVVVPRHLDSFPSVSCPLLPVTQVIMKRDVFYSPADLGPGFLNLFQIGMTQMINHCKQLECHIFQVLTRIFVVLEVYIELVSCRYFQKTSGLIQPAHCIHTHNHGILYIHTALQEFLSLSDNILVVFLQCTRSIPNWFIVLNQYST